MYQEDVTCCRCNLKYPNHVGSDSDIRIREWESEYGSLGNVDIICGYGSDWDVAHLTFRLNKQPIMNGKGATWDDLKSNPRLSWVQPTPTYLCNKCINELIKDKDIEFTFAGDARIHAYYPTYCDLCERYFDYQSNKSEDRCDVVVYHPGKVPQREGLAPSILPAEHMPQAAQVVSRSATLLMIRDYRKVNDYLIRTKKHYINDYLTYESCIAEYPVGTLDLGKAMRHFGRLCNKCMDNHFLGNKKMDTEIQKEIYISYMERHCKPEGSLYHAAKEEFYSLSLNCYKPFCPTF